MAHDTHTDDEHSAPGDSMREILRAEAPENDGGSMRDILRDEAPDW